MSALSIVEFMKNCSYLLLFASLSLVAGCVTNHYKRNFVPYGTAEKPAEPRRDDPVEILMHTGNNDLAEIKERGYEAIGASVPFYDRLTLSF